jgi:hypothetical protein
MKRRTRLSFIGCAAVVCGTFSFMSAPVGARIVEPVGDAQLVVSASDVLALLG